MLNQISVFVENKKGRLASVMETLEKNNIDVRALSIADASDFGIVRMIVEDSEKALKVIKENGYTVKLTKVIGFTVPDCAGALYDVINAFENEEINIDYCYSLMTGKDGQADIVVRVEDNDKAVKVLESKNIKLL